MDDLSLNINKYTHTYLHKQILTYIVGTIHKKTLIHASNHQLVVRSLKINANIKIFAIFNN